MTLRSRIPAAILAAAIAALVSGCARTRANTTPEMPGLDVPPPPPRVVEPTESEPPQPVPLVKEPARHAAPAPPRQNRPPEPPAKPEPPKPEAPKPADPVPEPAREEPRATPAPTPPLQTTPAQAEGEVERGIRGTLGKAQTDLSRVDYRRLNNDGRMQYDQAKRLAQQAEDALRAKNLVFARNLADKAAAIAGQLAGR